MNLSKYSPKDPLTWAVVDLAPASLAIVTNVMGAQFVSKGRQIMALNAGLNSSGGQRDFILGYRISLDGRALLELASKISQSL